MLHFERNCELCYDTSNNQLTMRIGLMFAVVGLLLTACGRSDTKLSKEIFGTWWQGNSVKIIFQPSGSFTMTMWEPSHAKNYNGTWQIKDGVLAMELTNESAGDARGQIGEWGHFKIINVSAHNLSYSSSGQTNIMIR